MFGIYVFPTGSISEPTQARRSARRCGPTYFLKTLVVKKLLSQRGAVPGSPGPPKTAAFKLNDQHPWVAFSVNLRVATCQLEGGTRDLVLNHGEGVWELPPLAGDSQRESLLFLRYSENPCRNSQPGINERTPQPHAEIGSNPASTGFVVGIGSPACSVRHKFAQHDSTRNVTSVGK
jgi:hypothetical protein